MTAAVLMTAMICTAAEPQAASGTGTGAGAAVEE